MIYLFLFLFYTDIEFYSLLRNKILLFSFIYIDLYIIYFLFILFNLYFIFSDIAKIEYEAKKSSNHYKNRKQLIERGL